MLRLGVQIVLLMLVALSVSACGMRASQIDQVPRLFEIRAVTVTGSEGVSRTVLLGVKRRLDRAISQTVRPASLPHAVMSIQIVNIRKGTGLDGGRAQSEVNVVMTDVASGEAVLVRGYIVNSFSVSPRTSDEAIAEAIAARLRSEFSLYQPAIRPMPTYEPAPDISTRMRGEEPEPVVYRNEDQPMANPLKTMPRIGADEDPVLNSRTKVNLEKPAKAVVHPDAMAKTADPEPAENAIEQGAGAKVVIKPKAADPAAIEPCVETMDRKC